MHEWSLMLALREQVLERAAAVGACRVERIVLRIGSLAGVDEQALQLVHQAAMAGSIAASAVLEIELVMAQAYCNACRAGLLLSMAGVNAPAAARSARPCSAGVSWIWSPSI